MAAFLFKVFTLTIRTIAKPLSRRVEAYVLDHPTLRQPVVNLAQVDLYIWFFCVTQCHDRVHLFGLLHHHEVFHMQTLHRFEVRVNRGAEGKSAKVFVGQLSEENALELAGKVISESFLWLVSHLSAHLPGAITAPEAFTIPLEPYAKDKAILAMILTQAT